MKKYTNLQRRVLRSRIKLSMMKIVYVIKMLMKPLGTEFTYRNRRVNRFVYIRSTLKLLK